MLVAMVLESSVVPIPSEAVILAAGYAGIPLWTIVWAGSIGSTLGGCLGYVIGRSGVRRVLNRYGRWIALTPARLARVDELAKRYGSLSVLIGRLVPLVPFKVFSISAGMSRVAFPGFVLMTAVGVIPRLVLLAVAGEWLRRATVPSVLVLLGIGVVGWCIHRRRTKPSSAPPEHSQT